MVKTETIKISEKKLTKLIRLLQNGDNLEKEKAMEELLSFPTQQVVEKTAGLLHKSETNVRMIVLEILKKIGYCSLDTITGLLYDENEDIRVYACEILAGMNDKRAVPALIKKLHDDSENVRSTACVALGEIKDEEAVDALVGVLRDDDWIKFSAIYSLGKIGSKKAIPSLLDIFEHDEKEVSMIACEVLTDMGDEEMLDKIIGILKKWNKKKRRDYIKVLLEKENEHIFQALKEKVGDELFELLLSVIENEDKKSLNSMILLANFRNLTACEMILDSFKGVEPGEDEYFEKLSLFAGLEDVWKNNIKQFMDKKDEYLLPLIMAAGIAKVKIDEDLLMQKYLLSSVDVKREIVKNLPAIVHGKGLSIIREAIADADGHVIGDAMTVICDKALTEMKDEIIDIVKKGFFDVRIKALKALMKLDVDDALDIIERFVGNGSIEDKKLYLSVAFLLDSNQNFPFVEKLLHDPEERVVKATVGVIGLFLDDDRYMDLFKALLMSNDIPHEVLKVIKDRKLSLFKDRLIEIFVNENSQLWTRYYALLALRVFEMPSLFEIFLKGLEDKDSLIKIGSLKALFKICNRMVS